MGLAERFILGAKDSVEKFSVGDVTLKKILTEEYNTDTGVTDRTFDDTVAPAAMYSAAARKGWETFSKTHFVIVFAGTHLNGTIPKSGDIVKYVDDALHKIDKVEFDQYGAAYFCLAFKQIFTLT